MRIAVLNGSPKGNLSVTVQYVRFAERHFPEHAFIYLPVAQQIRRIEDDKEEFSRVVDVLRECEAVIFAFPVYYMLVPAQFKRFIELLFERNVHEFLGGKYAAAVSTSVKFFDHLAHRYMHAICDDLQMGYFDFYSAAMYDLMRKGEQKRWLLFFNQFLDTVERRVTLPHTFPPLPLSRFTFVPALPVRRTTVGDLKVLVVKDGGEGSGNVDVLVRAFVDRLSGEMEVLDLRDVAIAGGCLGCIRCGWDNRCVYAEKDSYTEFYENRIKKADVLVFAGSIVDRFLSSRWKVFFDRSFYNNHIPTLTGKKLVFIISGPLSQVPHLQEMLRAYSEIQMAHLVGFITDEGQNNHGIEASMDELIYRLFSPALRGYTSPPTFPGVGGRKVLRDEIYGPLRFVFMADHKYYRKHNLYDFPQRHWRIRWRNLLMISLLRFSPLRRRFMPALREKMVAPLKSLVE